MINQIITAALHDVQKTHGDTFSYRNLNLTIKKVNSRLSQEGSSFLTKALPRLGKALDKALCHQEPLNATKLRFKPQPGTELPILFGEFFKKVLDIDGNILPDPCVKSVQVIRQLTYLFYKYKLPYTDEQEQKVVDSFKQAENDLEVSDSRLNRFADELQSSTYNSVKGYRRPRWCPLRRGDVPPWHSLPCYHECRSVSEQSGCRIRNMCDYPDTDPPAINGRWTSAALTLVCRSARNLLKDLFALFDPKDIFPRHGPGAVATKQRLWEKYHWSNISAKVTSVYPLDEFFMSSVGQTCDLYHAFSRITEEDLPARVILVPKDSRGPRLISCEPVDLQWVQQGLGTAIRELVEHHHLTRDAVHFTSQEPNQFGALLGSQNGRYATLDLKEASDRVSLDLVRLLFPESLVTFLEACRSSSTMLPDGSILKLRKFAPMGSNLCFPIMALTIWAILAAGAGDTYTRDRILVYGDDVIVPTAYAEDAIELLESFGLMINRDKSCTKGFFRESCGVDAFHGVDVTPIKLRTVWSSSPSADVYTSYIEYANAFYRKHFYHVFELISKNLNHVYGSIPCMDDKVSCPSLMVATDNTSLPRRWNKDLQRFQVRCRDVVTPSIRHNGDGWESLLRYFAEVANDRNRMSDEDKLISLRFFEGIEPFSVGTYTRRDTGKLVFRWR